MENLKKKTVHVKSPQLEHRESIKKFGGIKTKRLEKLMGMRKHGIKTQSSEVSEKNGTKT